MTQDEPAAERGPLVRHALRLEYLTVGWNIVEGVIAVTAALVAGSIALLGFGIDSFVESASGAVLIWRLRAESRARSREAIEELEKRAHRLVGVSLFFLAAYVTFEAAKSLWLSERPDVSPIGLVLLVVSLVVMQWLARVKRRAGRALGSRALVADAFQTTACWWLSLIALGGITLNALLGWWWADAVAALGMNYFIVKEGLEAWKGEDRCHSCS